MKVARMVVAIGALLCAAAANAQIGDVKSRDGKSGDPRVKKLLDSAGLKYSVDKDGDFRLVFRMPNGRTQLVFINSKSHTLDDMEIREIWSAGYVEDSVPGAVALNLLRSNSTVKLGAWQLVEGGGKGRALFCAKIAANTEEKVLVTTLEAVSQTADEKEHELTNTDNL